MQTFLIVFSQISLIVIAIFIAKKINIGYWIIGLVWGFYNEIMWEFAWNYSSVFGPTIYHDTPLFIITGWGAYLILTLSLSDR